MYENIAQTAFWKNFTMQNCSLKNSTIKAICSYEDVHIAGVNC